MYNKHTCEKVMYQAIVDNCLCVEFNTAKKRNKFVEIVKRSKNHNITCTSNVVYPWNFDDGKHNLKSPEEFAKIIKAPADKIARAIKNKYLQVEKLGDDQYIVEKNNTYKIKGLFFFLEPGLITEDKS